MRSGALAAALMLLAGCGGGKVDNVVRKPVAAFKVTQSTTRPQVFNLDAAGSFATVGELKSWFWTFGDENGGARTEQTAAATLHAYAAPGSYTITLVVADDKGTESEPVAQQVTVPTVNSELPTASITGPSTGTPGAALSFDGSGSTPEADLQNYVWSFGDPSSAQNSASGKTATSAQHQFSSAGTYRVTLTVTDSLGHSDTAELPVAISTPNPVALCTWSPQPALLGVPVTFDGSGSTPVAGSSISAYSWDFGDGSPAGTGQTATHTYNVLASFQPKLRVTDSLGRIGDSSCAEVVVAPLPGCSGNYTLTANPATLPGACLGSPVSWGGNKLAITQYDDGGMRATETLPSGLTALDGGSTATYSGSYSGAAFTLNGGYLQDLGMGTTGRVDVAVAGTLAGCASFTGTWTEAVSTSGIQVCTYTFNIAGSKL